ncbi:hypothetical protein CPB85DRAFT_1279415 [Mucidula mucida]|nr:hypothetical protein CPB85DRAFT_1279415 [Mucidula mucida]
MGPWDTVKSYLMCGRASTVGRPRGDCGNSHRSIPNAERKVLFDGVGGANSSGVDGRQESLGGSSGPIVSSLPASLAAKKLPMSELMLPTSALRLLTSALRRLPRSVPKARPSILALPHELGGAPVPLLASEALKSRNFIPGSRKLPSQNMN